MHASVAISAHLSAITTFPPALAASSGRSIWSVVPTPNPKGVFFPNLGGVSCASPKRCIAVGGYLQNSPNGEGEELIEAWNGSSWSIVPTPNVGTADNELLSIGGDTPNDLWAVGFTSTSAGFKTLIEHYDGVAWTVTSSSPAGPSDNVLTSVAASGPSDVWAVGYQTTPSGQYHSLVEHWNGIAWAVTPLPSANDSIDVLRSVFADTPSDAWAVGSYLGADRAKYQGFAIHWDGTVWSPASIL